MPTYGCFTGNLSSLRGAAQACTQAPRKVSLMCHPDWPQGAFLWGELAHSRDVLSPQGEVQLTTLACGRWLKQLGMSCPKKDKTGGTDGLFVSVSEGQGRGERGDSWAPPEVAGRLVSEGLTNNRTRA